MGTAAYKIKSFEWTLFYLGDVLKTYIFTTSPDEYQRSDDDVQTEWQHIKKMIAESEHENHLLTADAFRRENSFRGILSFEEGDSV